MNTQFEDLEQYLREEHLRNRERREARRLVEQMHLPVVGRNLRHTLRRAVAASVVVAVTTLGAVRLVPGPDYDYVCGANGDCAVCICNNVQSIYNKL